MSLHQKGNYISFKAMTKTFLFSSLRRFLPVLVVLQLNLSLIASDVSEELNDSTQASDSEGIYVLQQRNMERARDLVQKLYTESSEDLSQLLGNKNSYVELGTQAGYYGKEGTNQAYSPLVLYKRVWVSDSAIALSLAIQSNDPTADSRALWLLKNGQYSRYPENAEITLFAGWPFSSNQKNYGDSWTDCRFMTGANALTLLAMAQYITSDYYTRLSDKLKAEYLRFYVDALSGILYLVESSGPNEGLITAGWSLNVLEESSKTNYSYNQILDMLGYGLREIDGFTEPIKRVRVRNVVTEHCISTLAVLNYSLEHYEKLFKRNSSLTYNQLNTIREKMRESIYSKLYDNSKSCVIAGRSFSGKPNPYSSIDNATWLSNSLNFDELDNEQVKILSNSLAYTINNFTKDFSIQEKTYFGAHYYEEGFENVYVEKSQDHSAAFHVEATCSLICGLLEFIKAFPEDPNEHLFRSSASKLWEDLQYFINDFGFVYTSTSIKDISEPIEASVSAIWYLRACDYFKKNRITKVDLVRSLGSQY